MNKPSGHINQCLINFVMNKQVLICDKNNLRKYKKRYLTLKKWLLLKLQYFYLPQKLIPFIEVKINPINDRRQKLFTLRLANITLYFTNAFGSTILAKASLAQIHLI